LFERQIVSCILHDKVIPYFVWSPCDMTLRQKIVQLERSILAPNRDHVPVGWNAIRHKLVGNQLGALPRQLFSEEYGPLAKKPFL
jgi:hypothetical protein